MLYCGSLTGSLSPNSNPNPNPTEGQQQRRQQIELEAGQEEGGGEAQLDSTSEEAVVQLARLEPRRKDWPTVLDLLVATALEANPDQR